MSETLSTSGSDTSEHASISDELEQLWKESIGVCEQLEQLHLTILSKTSDVQQSLVEEEVDDDRITITYQGTKQDLMDVLDSIHQSMKEDPSQDLGSMLQSMLASSEFKTC